MSSWWSLVFAAALLCVLWIAARRAASVLVIHVEAGRVVEIRGRAPGELLHDLTDIFERARATGRVELLLDGGQVAVSCRGLSDGTEQQIRNVVGRFSAARLKSAPQVRPKV